MNDCLSLPTHPPTYLPTYLAHQCPGDGDPLFFAPREAHGAFPYQCVVSYGRVGGWVGG